MIKQILSKCRCLLFYERKGLLIVTGILLIVLVQYYSNRNTCGWIKFWDEFGFKRPRFVCVIFTGRIGNLLFSYSFMYAVSMVMGLQIVVPNNNELIDIFQINSQTPSTYGVSEQVCTCAFQFQDVTHCSYDPKMIENLPLNSHLTFRGYFQSWKYWKKYENHLRKLFQFKSHIKNKGNNILRRILSIRNIRINKTTLIGIHVRRGDHISTTVSSYGYKAANKQYLKNAMNYFRNKYKKVFFIAASDDIKWTKESLSNINDTYVLAGNSAAIDMAVLTLTNHTIMTVGTFGWWIGWLTNGTTIYYRHPFILGSKFSKHFKNVSEHFYPGWIGMD